MWIELIRGGRFGTWEGLRSSVILFGELVRVPLLQKIVFERHILDDCGCDRCQGNQEQSFILFFTVLLLCLYGSILPYFFQYLVDGPNTSFMEMLMWLKSNLNVQGLLACMALAWAAWSYRNSVVHDEPWSNIEVTAADFLKLVNNYDGHISKV